MNREVTNHELATFFLALVVGVLLVLSQTGCATKYPPTRVYEVEAFTLQVMAPDDLAELWTAFGNKGRAKGFYGPNSRRVFVGYDAFNLPLPHKETFGHEVVHLPELYDNFHE